MKNRDIAILVVVLIIVIVVVRSLIKKVSNTAQDTLSNATFGLTGRTVAGQDAMNGLLALPYLSYEWGVKATTKYNVSRYSLDYISTHDAREIAKNILNANSRLPLGIGDDSNKALAEIRKIQNQVQCVEVVSNAYNFNQQALFAKSLNWMSDEALIAALDHLRPDALPTGVHDNDNSGVQLTKLSI